MQKNTQEIQNNAEKVQKHRKNTKKCRKNTKIHSNNIIFTYLRTYLITILMTSQAGFDHSVISTCENFIEKVEQYYISLDSYLLTCRFYGTWSCD